MPHKNEQRAILDSAKMVPCAATISGLCRKCPLWGHKPTYFISVTD